LSIPRHLGRLIGILSVLAALATFAAVPAGAGPSATGPTTVSFAQNTGTVTVTWGGGYTVPMLGLYPAATACPTAGPVPPAPSFSIDLSGSTSPVIVSLSTGSTKGGWSTPNYDLLTSGSFDFCVYNKTFEGFDNTYPLYTLVNSSGWVGTVSASGPPGSSGPSLPAPPGSPAPPPTDDQSSATPAPQPITPSFTG